MTQAQVEQLHISVKFLVLDAGQFGPGISYQLILQGFKEKDGSMSAGAVFNKSGYRILSDTDIA